MQDLPADSKGMPGELHPQLAGNVFSKSKHHFHFEKTIFKLGATV
jgi:hypothetical protein